MVDRLGCPGCAAPRCSPVRRPPTAQCDQPGDDDDHCGGPARAAANSAPAHNLGDRGAHDNRRTNHDDGRTHHHDDGLNHHIHDNSLRKSLVQPARRSTWARVEPMPFSR